MSSRRPNLKAFTLIELLLMLVIIAIVAAIAAPTLGNFGRGRRLQNATTQLLAFAKYAQNQAIMDGVPYRLNFDLTTRSYWLTVENPPPLSDGTPQAPDGNFYAVSNQFGQQITLADNINLMTNLVMQPDGMYVEFEPNGRTDPATIELIDTVSNNSTYVGSLSATERFHVFNDDEQQAVQQ